MKLGRNIYCPMVVIGWVCSSTPCPKISDRPASNTFNSRWWCYSS